MAFCGFESDRDTLKYRCPAAAHDLGCKGRATCYRTAGCTAGDYGRIVRNFLQTANRHVFTPVPHDSPCRHRGYNRRDALERINPRLDNSFGLKRHYSRGKASMTTRVGLALGHVLEGCPGRMRSLVAPVPFRGAG